MPASSCSGKGEPLPATVTLTERAVVPPLPVQLRVNVVVLVNAPVDTALPLVALLPLQPPEAVQAVAFVVLQVNAEDAPLAILVGVAENVTPGAGFTVTVVD